MLEKTIIFREKEDMLARLLDLNNSEPFRQYLYEPLLERAATEVKAPSEVLMIFWRAIKHLADKAPQYHFAALQLFKERGGYFIDALIDDEIARGFTKTLLAMKMEELERLRP